MMLWVQIEDYFDESYKDFIDQVPVYIITFLLTVYDLILWAGCCCKDRVVDNANSNNVDETIKIPRHLMIVYILLFLVHIGEGIYWSIEWAINPNELGYNDWGALISMSKAMGHWITIFLLLLFISVRLSMKSVHNQQHSCK